MASRRHLRRKMCTGKHRHQTKARAIAQLIALDKSGRSSARMRPYQCRFCNRWHVGHFARAA